MYPPSYNNGNYAAEGVPAGTISNFPQPCAPPHTPPIRRGKPTQWSTGLCHCCDDPANALITCFCPCVTFGQIAEILNQGSVSCAGSGAMYALVLGLTAFPCLYSCFYRSRLRGQYDLEEEPAPDCLVHFCCEVCSLCQEYRELKNRGFDMSIGYQANMNRQRRGITVAPTIGGMTR